MAQNTPTQTGILLIDRNKLYFYETLIPSVFTLDLPIDVARDIEIINQDKLNIAIKTFVDTNKIKPAKIIIVLTQNMFFEKDFPVNTTEEQYQNYVDYVPFEEVIYKKFPLTNGMKIVITNKDYYEKIIVGFAKAGIMTTSVLPTHPFGKIIQTLDTESIKLILAKYDVLKEYNFLAMGERSPNAIDSIKEETPLKVNENKRQFILIGVFVFLMLVLVAVIIKTGTLKL